LAGTAILQLPSGRALFERDVWDVRDRYGDVVAFDGETLTGFVTSELRADVDADGTQRARELLEMQRATLRLFTSCAWFFDEVDRIETRQVLARALALSEWRDARAGVRPCAGGGASDRAQRPVRQRGAL
jgi:hypothetical protein